MSIEELVAKLELLLGHDPEEAHAEADRLLLVFINDKRVAKAFEAIEKWYA